MQKSSAGKFHSITSSAMKSTAGRATCRALAPFEDPAGPSSEDALSSVSQSKA
jgi:hypothetical protein